MRIAALSGCLALAACTEEPGAPPTPAVQHPVAPQLPTLEHDFGVIPHPESREHEFVIDPAPLAARCIPLRTQLDCSCGRADMRIRHRDGKERPIDGSPNPDNALGPDDRLVVRVVIDTITKEAIDLAKVASRGQVILQPIDDASGRRRVSWPLLLHYGIDCPVAVHPFTAFDFERVPLSRVPEIQTTIRGDAAHPDMKFPSVASSDAAVEAVLEPATDHVRLRVRCHPGELGNHRCLVSVATDAASGYRVNFAVTWKAVPDLEATPMAKISFRADTSHAQTEAATAGQFVIVTDHDLRRPAEFAVHEVVDDEGRDARTSFAVELQPVPGQPRQQRLRVRYLGGRNDTFRGQIVLTKGGADGPFLPIELVMFHSKQ